MSGTRDRLIAATNELFRRRGYNGTGLKDITTAAGATTGSLYHFFPGGKSELAAATIVESGRAYEQLFEAIADESRGVAEAVSEFFDGAAAVLAETDYIDVCPIGTVAREVANTDEMLRIASDRVFTSWIRALTSRLVDAGLEQEESEALAVVVVAALEGGFILSRTARSAELLRSIGGQMHDLVAARVSASTTARRRPGVNARASTARRVAR